MIYVLFVGTCLAVVTSIVCAGHLYRYRRKELGSGLPVFSLAIFVVTAVITGLSFVFPEVLALLRRDLDGLLAGEWWRAVTPLFLQPGGWLQCVLNGMFMVAWVPMLEKLYGKGALAIYFIAGVAAQALIYTASPVGGGSSSALFGAAGGILIYVCRNRKAFPPQYFPIALAGLCGAAALCFVRGDGHGRGMLIGALVGSLLPAKQLAEKRTGSQAKFV